jgi:hypothetical protein
MRLLLRKWAEKYATRVDFEMDGILNTDIIIYGRYNDFFGKRAVALDLQVLQARIHLLPAGRTH